MAWWFGDEADKPVADLLARKNSLLLFDAAQAVINENLIWTKLFVGSGLICRMHGIAMAGLDETAGAYRGDGPIKIFASGHTPPSHVDVPGLVDEMCSTMMLRHYDDPVWAASYALWRLNWIHPFPDGNGRTARVLAHIVLLTGIGMAGFPNVQRHLPDRIGDEKIKYYRCLEESDRAFKRSREVNVSHMQGFLEKHLRDMLREAGTG